MKSFISVLLIIVSLCLLVPGVTQPILTIQGTIEKAELVDTGLDMLSSNLSSDGTAKSMLDMAVALLGLDTIEGEVIVFNKSRSIIGTINELYQSQHLLVAVLIGLFSIVVPACKLLLMILALLSRPSIKRTVNSIINVISKWSMADVFVVALIIVYMAGNASAGMGEILKTSAQFGSGFYYFTAYCLFSIASQMVYTNWDK